MNLFEKVFNYQIMTKLEYSGTLMISALERSWLKYMLQHSCVSDAFAKDTLRKLQHSLEQDSLLQIDNHFIQKAGSTETHIYHPHLRPLSTIIRNRSSIIITSVTKKGQNFLSQKGLPYKLEYSMVKREWYLLWYKPKNRMMMNTKLKNIISFTEEKCPEEQYDQLQQAIADWCNKQRVSAEIQVIPAYNEELSRILYAFSCFEKEVSYDPENHQYTVTLFFASSDREYILSKVRFLGKRVKISRDAALQRRMLESATKALERYAEHDQEAR